MRVLKFGGSSLADSGRIKNAVAIATDSISAYGDITIVVSAMSGVTNSLSLLTSDVSDTSGSQALIRSIESKHLQAAQELVRIDRRPSVMAEIISLCNALTEILRGASLVGEVTPRTRDLVLSFGERLSAWLFYNTLIGESVEAVLADSRQLIRTNSDFGNARVLTGPTNNLIQSFFMNYRGIKVVTGFIASNETGHTTTLGRNGSDYSASIIGAAAGAEAIEIWTDTDGVLTADPSIVPEARNIPRLTYTEAMELSHFGARVIFPASIQPAMAKSIPVIIKNTGNPRHHGTIVSDDSCSNGSLIRGITSLSDIATINIEGCGMVGVAGVAARLFGALSSEKINVIMISQASSEHSICIAVREEDAGRACTLLESVFKTEIDEGLISSVACEKRLSIIAVVGSGMRQVPGVASRIFRPLGSNNINIKVISQGSSELNISFIIKQDDLIRALNILHKSLIVQGAGMKNK